MNNDDKRRAWSHIQQHSPHQESFIRALKKSFGSIELVSYRQIKNPSQASNGLSKTVLAGTSKGVFADD